MEERNTNQDSSDFSSQALPSPSDKGKRKSALQGESSEHQPAKRQCGSTPGSTSEKEARILSDVKCIMKNVSKILHGQDELSVFLKKKITELDKDKREMVGVFGKTGVGKSSLINAIIDNRNLLPCSKNRACTTVTIKVEANMDISEGDKYQAVIEFIKKEDWREELEFLLWAGGENSHEEMEDNSAQHDNADDDCDEEDDDSDEEDDDSDDEDDRCYSHKKLSALYGEEWKGKKEEFLMNKKHFKEIPEFLRSERKTLTCRNAEELSEKLEQYTTGTLPQGGIKRLYWPLVNCVTVRVPHNDLQYVTLVDLPGNGDRIKHRDEMWKRIVGKCSTVWIVTDSDRPADNKESWTILKRATNLIGNGGECQRIHIICTRCDLIGDEIDLSTSDVHERIVGRNQQNKNYVKEEYSQRRKIKEHFGGDNFRVFTVSSTKFLTGTDEDLQKNELPLLKKVLKNLNGSHSEPFNYVDGAHVILSMIQKAGRRNVADSSGVSHILQEKLKRNHDKVEQEIEKAKNAFEKSLTKGVKKSLSSYKERVENFLNKQKGGAFHMTLKSVVKKGGIHTTKKGKQIDLNMMLATWLFESIDKKFRKTFPCSPWSDTLELEQMYTPGQKDKCGPFSGVINAFSLGTNKLIENHGEFTLELTFLKKEEENLKAKLNEIIRQEKKIIYRSLTETIEERMKTCYNAAKDSRGKDSLKNMRNTITEHINSNTDMFEEAKNAMLKKMVDLKKKVLDTLKTNMEESITFSLEAHVCSLPDVSEQLAKVKQFHEELTKMKKSTQ